MRNTVHIGRFVPEFQIPEFPDLLKTEDKIMYQSRPVKILQKWSVGSSQMGT